MAPSITNAIWVGVLGLFGGFFMWTPAPLPDSHFADIPFEWPTKLTYRSVVAADDLEMMCYSSGPESKSERRGSIVFTHGFPETAASWKDYVLHFSAQGYYVLACDMRNVNNSISTSGTQFSVDQMADDIKGLSDAIGVSKVAVVCHDWGCGPAQAFSAKYPDLVSALVTMSVPHLELYRWYNTVRLPIALKKVWYFLFFGLTGHFARWKIVKDEFGWFIWFILGSSKPGAFSKAEVEHLKDVWSQRMADSMSSTVTTWYTTGCIWLLKGLLPPGMISGLMASMWSSYTPISPPTLQLHGTDDIYVAADEMIEANPDQSQFFPHPKSRYKLYPGRTHWLPRESQDEVIADIATFLDEVLA